MKPQYRLALVRVHACIAAFCLPVGIMFLVTGGLMTAGIKGETSKEVFFIQLSEPVVLSESGLLQLAESELDKRGMEYPTGRIHYRDKQGNKELKWSGLNRSLRLIRTTNPRIARLTVKTPGWLYRFTQLHKADGKEPFKVYAMAWAVLLLTLFITGVAMAWQVRKLRLLVITSAMLGMVTFIVLLFHSIWG